MDRGDAGRPDSTGPQKPPAKAQLHAISLPMGGRSIGGIIKKSRRVSLPDLLICILILQWISKEDTPYSETFIAIDTNFAKLAFTITMLHSLDSFFHIFFRANIVSLIDGRVISDVA